MNPSHHRLVHLDARRREDRQKGYPECLECLPRLPNVKNLDLAVRLKGDVGDASVGSSGTCFAPHKRAGPIINPRARKSSQAAT